MYILLEDYAYAYIHICDYICINIYIYIILATGDKSILPVIFFRRRRCRPWKDRLWMGKAHWFWGGTEVEEMLMWIWPSNVCVAILLWMMFEYVWYILQVDSQERNSFIWRTWWISRLLGMLRKKKKSVHRRNFPHDIPRHHCHALNATGCVTSGIFWLHVHAWTVSFNY